MKSFMLMACLAFSYVAVATAEDGVYSIVKGDGGEPHIVKFNSGAVKFIEQNDFQKLKDYEKQLRVSKFSYQSDVQNKMLLLDDPNYEVTKVPDSEISGIFSRQNPYMRRKSECSDRAHVWTWDEFKLNNTKSQKAFLMLTDTYIRRTRYKWWFHVAPLYTTTTDRKIIMDKQFFDHPVTLKQWKETLVFSTLDCVTDFRFLDYNAGADQTQDCYLKTEPMYYYVPGDIGSFENGRGKTNWNTFEVNGARSRAFFQGSI